MTDKNDFPMPMIKTPEFAANEMYKGIVHKKNFETHFPKSFTSLMKILKFLPNNIYFKYFFNRKNLGMKRKIRD